MLRQGGRRLVLATLALAVLNSVYNTLYLVGVKTFDIASGVFTFSMTVVMLPVVMISMRRRVEAATWVSVVLVTPGIVLALGPLVRMSDAGGGERTDGGVLLPPGIVEGIVLTLQISLGAVLVMAGSLAEILDLGGKRREALP